MAGFRLEEFQTVGSLVDEGAGAVNEGSSGAHATPPHSHTTTVDPTTNSIIVFYVIIIINYYYYY